MVALRDAYASCARDARTHYENFPVASLLLPRAMRPHVAAVYAFARAADDFADEGERTAEERIRLLEGWRTRLRLAVASGQIAPPGPGEPDSTVHIFTALAATIRAKALPLALFEDLLSAFTQDVRVTRYGSWDDLLDYCRRSANPVGRLVLRIAGYCDDRMDAQSDAICTALQLTNFWQDLGIDAARGRIYVPMSDMASHRASPEMLVGGTLPDPWRRVLADVTTRTRALFVAGRPLCDAVAGRLQYELRATWLGGMRILAKLEAHGFDPIARRPTLGARDAAVLACGVALFSLSGLRPHCSPRGAGA